MRKTRPRLEGKAEMRRKYDNKIENLRNSKRGVKTAKTNNAIQYYIVLVSITLLYEVKTLINLFILSISFSWNIDFVDLQICLSFIELRL